MEEYANSLSPPPFLLYLRANQQSQGGSESCDVCGPPLRQKKKSNYETLQ